MSKPLMLLIRDGWGIGNGGPGDAVAAANTPNMDALLEKYPTCTLDASGIPVGVRAGSQGSSEVGHLNMGAGRIVKQEIVRVDEMIADGSLFETPRLIEAVKRCKQQGKAFHLMGLVQDQGVHAMGEHFAAFIKFLSRQGVEKVFVHFFADGRDTPPRSAIVYLKQLEDAMKQYKCGRVATVMGRFWAMDRAENWARTEKAFNLLTKGIADYTAPSASAAIEAAYRRADEQIAAGKNNAETDEFICPTAIVDAACKPVGTMQAGDAVLHLNYRQDRAIQLTHAFVENDFSGFNRGPKPDVFYMGLTRYYDEFPFELIPPMNMANLLGEVLSANKLRQLRIAEFQKYKHVTSFFNGKLLEPLPGEDRIQVESITIPEDQQPEMSAYPVTDLVLKAVNDGISAVRDAAKTTSGVQLELGAELPGACPLNETYDVIVLNYANGDMVGHTGSFEAARKAIETVDECMGKVIPAVLSKGGTVIVTSDHGNAEQMLDESGKTQTAHTVSPVHCVLVGKDVENAKLIPHGKLADVAPTMLKLLGIKIPAEMTAECLIK